MSAYTIDDNGNQRVRMILVDMAGNCVETGNPINAKGPYYKDSNGVEYLLVLAFDETGAPV